MIEKLETAAARYDELSTKLSDPKVISDNKLYTELMREYKNLTPLMDMYKKYKSTERSLEDARAAIEDDDPELRRLAESEADAARNELERCAEEPKLLLLPRDPDDDKSVIVEIRAGAGGEEAALFANSMFRMYSMYAARQGWRIDVMSSNPTELGGYREISFGVEGDGVYSKLKYESGVHRVQRVPETESQGRIQTSTVTVAILPEVEEVDVNINPADLTVQTFRSSGAGGQHINKTESAVKTARDSAIAEDRRIQVGTGDRSERIRTYNFPQSRVTDHRINLTLYKLDDMMNGGCDEFFEALRVADITAKLVKQEK